MIQRINTGPALVKGEKASYLSSVVLLKFEFLSEAVAKTFTVSACPAILTMTFS